MIDPGEAGAVAGGIIWYWLVLNSATPLPKNQHGFFLRKVLVSIQYVPPSVYENAEILMGAR
jgi:hypothetical protein